MGDWYAVITRNVQIITRFGPQPGLKESLRKNELPLQRVPVLPPSAIGRDTEGLGEGLLQGSLSGRPSRQEV